MQIVIHRGSKEIGGSCIEIASENSRIILDVGLPLAPQGNAPSLANGNVTSDPTQSLPMLPIGSRLEKATNAGATETSGVILSHAHLDHYGLLLRVHEGTPVYASEGTRSLVGLTEIFSGKFLGQKNWRIFEAGTPFSCGDFTITPYLMDHSAFDAHGFVIEAEGKRVIYTGDFRNHGRKSKAYDYFLKHVPPIPDALLMEGTMLGREGEKVRTEKDLEREAIRISRAKAKMVLVCQSGQNIDRLVTFYRAAVQSDRLFIIDVYTACVLDTLSRGSKRPRLPHPSKDFEKIRVFYPWGITKRLFDTGNEEIPYRFRPFRISREEIKQRKDQIMMVIRPSMMGDLSRLGLLDGATLIYSMWAGYLQEEPGKRLTDFAKSNSIEMINLHTSGHAAPMVLQQLVRRLAPKRLVPIHTLHPSRYTEFSDKVVLLDEGQILSI